MLVSDRDKRTCERYSARDEFGNVRCVDCPLRKGIGAWDYRCKANSHYDRKEGEWVYDEVTV